MKLLLVRESDEAGLERKREKHHKFMGDCMGERRGAHGCDGACADRSPTPSAEEEARNGRGREMKRRRGKGRRGEEGFARQSITWGRWKDALALGIAARYECSGLSKTHREGKLIQPQTDPLVVLFVPDDKALINFIFLSEL